MKTKTVKGNWRWNWRTNKLDLPFVFLIGIFFFLAGLLASSLFPHSQVFLRNNPNHVVFLYFKLFFLRLCFVSLESIWNNRSLEFAGTWTRPEADAESEVNWKIDGGGDGVSFVASWRIRRRFHYIDSFSGARFRFFMLRNFFAEMFFC